MLAQSLERIAGNYLGTKRVRSPAKDRVSKESKASAKLANALSSSSQIVVHIEEGICLGRLK